MTLSGQTMTRPTNIINNKAVYDSKISVKLTPSGKKQATKTSKAANTKLIFFAENRFLKFFILTPKPQLSLAHCMLKIF